MAASMHDTILRVFGKDEGAERTLRKVATSVEAFERVKAEATLDLEDRRVTEKLREARAQLARFARDTATANADVNTTEGRAALASLEHQLNQVDRERVSPEVNAKVTKALLALQALQARLERIDHEKVEIDVDVRRGVAEKALALERSIDGIVREAGQGTEALSSLGGAAGGAGSSLGSASGGAGFFGGALRALVAAGLALIPVIGSIVGALGALIGSLGAAAAAAGALTVALGAAMGPALGVVGATGARVAGVLQTQKENTMAAASASKDAAKASDELAQAHEREYKATVQVRDARESLVTAIRNYREAARQAWKEIREASRDVLRTEKEAARSIKAAQAEETRSVQDLADARQAASRVEIDAIEASEDANRRLRDALTEVRDAYNGIRDAQLDQRDAALSLLDSEDALEGQQKTLRKALEGLGLSGSNADQVLATLGSADLSSLDVGGLFSGFGLELTPDQIENVSDAARELQHAQLGVESSSNRLSDATDGLGNAQNDLTDALKEQAGAQKEVNGFAEKGLAAYSPYVDALEEVKEASRAVAKADGETARIKAKSFKEIEAATAALIRLEKDGIRDSGAVVAAAETLRDAHQALTEALRQQAKAGKEASQAAGGAAGGGGGGGAEVEELTGLNKRFAQVLGKVKEALTNAFKPATTAVLRGMVVGLQAIVPLIRELRPGLTAIGQVIGGLAASAGKALAGPEWTKALKFFVSSSATVTKLVGESFGSLAVILRNIAVASMPFLISGLRKVSEFLQSVAGSTSDVGKLRDDIGGLVEHLRAWLGLARSLGGLMVALLGGETAKAGKDMVETLTEGSDALAAWGRSAKGQEAIKRFFEDTRPLLDATLDLLGKLVVAGLAFTQAVAPVMAPFVKGLGSLVGVLTILLGLFSKIPAPIRELVGQALNLVFGFGKLEAIVGAVKLAIDKLGGAFSAVSAAIGGAAGAVADAAKDVGVKALSAITGLFSDATDAGKGLIGKVAAGITAAISDPVGAAGVVVDAIIGKVTGGFDRALNAGRGLFEKVRGGINAAFSAVVGVAGDIVNAIIGKVTGGAERAFNAAENLFGKVKAGINSAFGAVVGAAGDIINAVIDKITDAWDRARATAETLFEKAKAGIDGARDVVVTAAQGLINAAIDQIRNAAGTFFNAGKALIQNFIDGIKSLADAVSDAVKGVAGKAADLLPGSEPKDPSSPLRGLPHRGEALIENFARGIREAAPRLAHDLAAGLDAMVATPQMNFPYVAPAATGDTHYNYDLSVQSPAGEIADPRLALALLDTELRARGGLS